VNVLRAIRAFPPHGWLMFGLQMLLLFAANAVYEVSRALLEGSADVALAHAHDIIRAERALGIFVERDIQQWALDGPGFVVDVARWTYQNCQRLITWSFVLWLYLRRNAFFPRVRNTIITLDVLGLAGYFLYPTAPPRLTPGFGFVDVLDPSQANLRSSLVGSLTNLYAAVPSLHSAYALLLGITGYRACRHLVTRLIWALYPALVVFATVATGNHWLLDAVAGFAVLAIAWAVVSRLPAAANRPVAPPVRDATAVPAQPG
jgi:membrane-associated phospholipid phosphatase